MADEGLSLEQMVAADAATASSTSTTAEETSTTAVAEPEATTTSTDEGIAGGETTSTETAEDGAAEAEAKAETVQSEEEYTLQEFLKDRAQERGKSGDWVDKYKTHEDLADGILELQSKLAERDTHAQTVQWMRDNGITADDLKKLAAMKAGGGEAKETTVTQPVAKESPLMPDEWYTTDKAGNVIPTAEAPADFDARLAKHNAFLTSLYRNPAKLAKWLKEQIVPDIEKTAGQKFDEVKTSVQAQREADRAAMEAQQKREAWHTQNAAAIYVDPKDIEGKGLSPLGKRVNDLLTADPSDPRNVCANPAIPWDIRADMATKLAAAETRTPVKKALPALAKRTVTPAAGTKKQITEDEWMKSKGSLMDFAMLVGDPLVTKKK